MEINDHISREQFLLEFFGFFGRELGNPHQFFTEEPMQIISFVEECASLKQPAFISVNPRIAHDKVLGIEKLFYDFDYGKKSDNLSPEKIEIKKKECQEEVVIFLAQLAKECIVPLVVKTRKGFHVYIYFDKIYQVKDNDFELLDETYYQLMTRFLNNNRHKYIYMDSSVIHDSKRMCRIPTSIHEKSNEECYLVKKIKDGKIEKDKLRGMDYWKSGGLKEDDWIRAVNYAYTKLKKQKEDMVIRQNEKKENWELNHGFVGKIRPCFQKAMDSGEMGHQMRLALLLEAYWADYNTPEKMLDLFRCFHDYDGDVTAGKSNCREQIEWFWKNKVPDIEKSGKWKPYRCTTLEDLNACLKSQCLIYQKKKVKMNEQKST